MDKIEASLFLQCRNFSDVIPAERLQVSSAGAPLNVNISMQTPEGSSSFNSKYNSNGK